MEPVRTIWGYLKELSDTPTTTSLGIVSRLYIYDINVRTNIIYWHVQAKGELGKAAAMTLIPKPGESPSSVICLRSLRLSLRNLPDEIIGSVKKIEIEENGTKFSALVLYPKGYDQNNKEKCVVYHSPNGVRVDELIYEGLDPNSAPYHIFKKTGAPLILYDYRGIGINQGYEHIPVNNVTEEIPGRNSVLLDGISILNYALKEFKRVDVWGSSLGGAIATLACEAYVNEHPNEGDRLSLYSLDSYRSTEEVVIPSNIAIYQLLSKPSLDAEEAMKNLLKRNIKVVVLCHTYDPVIRLDARMAARMIFMHGEHRVITSHKYGHGNLTEDMLAQL